MQSFSKILILLIGLNATSCDNSNNEQKEADPTDAISKTTFKKEIIEVEITEVQQGSFNLEILSNGKAFAVNSTDIRFPINENISGISIRNGDKVQRGQLLASLDNTELQNKLVRSREALNKAIAELDDRLINYGYRLRDSVKIPKDIMQMAKVRSGFNNARYDYADALTALGKTKVYAPFSGKIADIEARPYASADAFKKLCTLIDDSRMRIEFNVLETEYSFLGRGSALEIEPIGGGYPLKGTVTEINPQIDNNGMIKIIGTINNSAGHVLNGMSMKVIIKKPVSGALYVPKEAVVQRDNRQVVFTYEDGLAKWNYVETGLQNSKYICIKSGLQQGQKVIINNNINLADDSEVTLVKAVNKSE